mmetsp:Transcript_6793/g.13414  ORF Transcript_6793/g.13414 Transcript_6793/m.13414 type:complete len:540 (-) Transcript_6793:1023-2642(-)
MFAHRGSASPRRSDYDLIEEAGGGGESTVRGKNEDLDDAELARTNLLGGKTLGLFSSIVIVVNNIAGPGMLVLPRVYQDAGWVMPTLVLSIICVTSALVATFLVDVMARIPGNSSFQRRIEFVNIFDEFWGKKGMHIAQIMFIMNMIAQIVSSIVSNAQVMDAFIVFLNPNQATYALQILPYVTVLSWRPPMDSSGAPLQFSDAAECHASKVVPFQDDSESRVVISLGYLSLALMLVPMSNMNLDDNIFIQKVSFYMLLVLSGEFLLQFFFQGLEHHHVPAFGGDYSHVLGSIIFNYAFIAIIPSWLNEKRPDVSVTKTVWISSVASTLLYAATGMMGAMAYTRADGNFLNTLSNSCSPTVTRISAFLFAFGMIGLGIPFISIVTRYSLLVGRVCGPRMSNFWSVYFPWLVSWLFYEGGLFTELIAWGGDLAIGPINFVMPLLVTLTALGVTGIFRLPFSSDSQRGFMTPARPGDSEDKVNSETIVDPLPSSIKRYYRPIASVCAVVLFCMILASIASHSSRTFNEYWRDTQWADVVTP